MFLSVNDRENAISRKYNSVKTPFPAKKSHDENQATGFLTMKNGKSIFENKADAFKTPMGILTILFFLDKNY